MTTITRQCDELNYPNWKKSALGEIYNLFLEQTPVLICH